MEIPFKLKTTKLNLNFLPDIFPKPNLREMTKSFSEFAESISLSFKFLVSTVFFIVNPLLT